MSRDPSDGDLLLYKMRIEQAEEGPDLCIRTQCSTCRWSFRRSLYQPKRDQCRACEERKP